MGCVCEREGERELAATKILSGSSMEFAVPLPERECKDLEYLLLEWHKNI